MLYKHLEVMYRSALAADHAEVIKQASDLVNSWTKKRN